MILLWFFLFRLYVLGGFCMKGPRWNQANNTCSKAIRFLLYWGEENKGRLLCPGKLNRDDQQLTTLALKFSLGFTLMSVGIVHASFECSLFACQTWWKYHFICIVFSHVLRHGKHLFFMGMWTYSVLVSNVCISRAVRVWPYSLQFSPHNHPLMWTGAGSLF